MEMTRLFDATPLHVSISTVGDARRARAHPLSQRGLHGVCATAIAARPPPLPKS